MKDVAAAIRALDEVSRGQHPCQVFRLFPWTFPRAAFDENDSLTEKVGILTETADLLLSCPTWSFTAPGSLPLHPALMEFRVRWSHQKIVVAAPARPDYGDALVATAYWCCMTDLAWRVIGPPEFLQGLSSVVDRQLYSSEVRRVCMRPGRRPRSLFLCRHEIRGD